MATLSEISKTAQDTLVEAKLIKGEQGPEKLKKYVDKFFKKAAKPDKTDLCRTSNFEIFFMFLILANDNTLSFEETLAYCEEVKKAINSWTYDKDGHRLHEMQNGTNDDGTLRDYKYLSTLTDLGLTPIFVSYNMKLVYMCMYEFLKLKKDILQPQELTKKLPVHQRIKIMNNIYKQSKFHNFVEVAGKCMDRDTRDHEHRQYVSGKRIETTKEVISKIDDGTILTIEKIPGEWHQFLDPLLLELIYEIILDNLYKSKTEVEQTEQELLDKKNKSSLTTYLYNHNLNPYSLNERLQELEAIPNIIEKIDFLKFIGIPLNDVLTKYSYYLTSLTEDQIKYLSFLIGNGILSNDTLKENLNIIEANYQKIISNYEILKDIVDFQNIFYDDKTLFKDIREIKIILSGLKEYKLSKNNYIFLLCHYEYLSIYDLMIENDLPESLFISICETENPLNTIKRILIYRNIGEPYETPNHFLKKDVTSEIKFVCDDSSLDEYLPNVVTTFGTNLLNGTSISTITENTLVKKLDDEYRVDNAYLIGDTTISRPKFLRNFESVQGNPSYLISSLVSNSILDETSYFCLVNELNGKKLKK